MHKGTIYFFKTNNCYIFVSKKNKLSVCTSTIYIITYVIHEEGLDDAVGIELVTTFTNAEGKEHIYSVEPMEVIKKEGN